MTRRTRIRPLLALTILVALLGLSSPYVARGQSLTPHGPIVINGDGQFTPERGVRGGSGTILDPFLIEGWEITTTASGAGISITNTRSYFIVGNVYVHPMTLATESSGAYLINVENGRIEDSRFTNTSYGVWMSLSNRNMISNNTIWGFTRSGLYIVGGSENIIAENNISSNFPGVKASLRSDPLIKYVDSNNDNRWTGRSAQAPEEPIVYDSNNNTAYDTGEPSLFGGTPADGASLKTDPRITFFDFNNNGSWDLEDSIVHDSNQNRVYNSGELVLSGVNPEGIRVIGLAANTLNRNRITNLHTGFLVANTRNSVIENNIVANASYYGFRVIAQTSTSTFANNTVTGTSFALVFDYSTNNLVIGNLVVENDYGIGLEGLTAPNTDITITGNTVIDNLYGIYTFNSAQNLIYDNYIRSLVSNAFDQTGQNSWNTTKTLGRNILGGPFLGGNFFHDYQGADQDGDGLGDSSYRGLDRLPLVRNQPSIVRDLAIRTVKVEPSSVRPGESFTVTVSPFNQGTVEETFTVTTLRDLVLLDTRTLTLGPWSQTGFSFTWNTAGLPSQTYAVKANATIIQGERDTSDNTSPVVQATINSPPTASFTVTPQAPTVNQEALFDGSSSTDPDGTVLSYSWGFGDGQTSSGVTARQTYATAGPYNVALTVTDNLGGTASTTRMITVTALLNQNPHAAFTVEPAAPIAGEQTTFDASSSNDPDGTIGVYDWDFGDSQTGSGPVVTHTFSSPGVFGVKLTVTDNVGGTGFIVKQITVGQTPATRPTAPTNLQIATGTGRMTLTWSQPYSDGGAPITAYRIYRGLSPLTLTLIATVNNALTYEDTAILRGETYTYRISAVNSAGEGELSGNVQGQVPRPATTFLLDDPLVLTGIAGLVVAALIGVAVFVRGRMKASTSPEESKP